jgi:alpha-L-fucosidase
MRKIFFLILVLILYGTSAAIGQSATAQNVTSEKRKEWFMDARFGMMITWGAYSQMGGYWKGVYQDGYSEWLKFRQIPNVEYDSMVREFNPVEFNAEEWIRIVKNAGMKYIVVMAKHHDGFALYDSKVSTYDIIDMTRFGRDPLAELAAACQKAGVKFGVYYSVDRDWHHPDAACDDHYKQCNFWDYPQNLSPGAMERWHRKYFPYAAKQVEELVTRYPVDLIWFDGIGLKTRAEIALLDSIIHTNRPNCLINSRISSFVGSTDLASCPIPAGSLNPFAEVIEVSDGYDAAVNTSPYPDRKYSGSMFILTTPEGADLHIGSGYPKSKATAVRN